MKSLFLLLICSCLLSLLALPAEARADLYKYTDADGVVNMTNNLKAVPSRYRSTTKVVHEEKKAQPAQQAEEPPVEPAVEAAAPAPAQQSKFAELSGRYVWFKPLLFVSAALAAFLCLIKVSSMIPSRLVGRLIIMAFSAGIIAFLYKANAERVLEQTRKLKEDAAAIAKKSAARQQSMGGDDLPAEEPKK